MHRIDGPGATPDNRFTEGDPVTAVPATEVTADWLNAVQEEIVNVIQAAGIALDKQQNDQLLAAIREVGGNLSAWAKAFVASTSPAQARSALETGTAATRDVTTSPTDTTPGRVLTVGSLGLGEPILLTSSDDLDDIMSPGIYRHSQVNAPANTPVPEAGIVTVFTGEPSSFVVQVWRRRNGQVRKFQRVFDPNSGVWSSWVEFYHSGNIGENLVPTSRTISTGTGLTGGGNLSANRTISLASSHYPIGVGQTWQDVTSSRSANTIYTNTTGRSIFVVIFMNAQDAIAQVSSNGTNWVTVGRTGSSASSCSFVVPAGWRYRSTTSGYTWSELR